jgi:hypothetical protein
MWGQRDILSEVGVEKETMGVLFSEILFLMRFFGVSNCKLAKLSWSIEEVVLAAGEWERGDEGAPLIIKQGTTNMV